MTTNVIDRRAYKPLCLYCHDSGAPMCEPQRDILEYGTSPRFGWLTPQGESLKAFMASKSVDDLVQICDAPPEYAHCTPDYCNCDLEERCVNPFWSNP